MCTVSPRPQPAAADPTESPAYRGTHGDTSYYFFENPDLPLFGPLRTLGVPESLIDVVEPFFRVIVDTGLRPQHPAMGAHACAVDPAAQPGEGGCGSRRRDRRGDQQRTGDQRLGQRLQHRSRQDRRGPGPASMRAGF